MLGHAAASPTTCSRACAPGDDSLLGLDALVPQRARRSPGRASPSQRDCFDELGGFDERFVLCGSDVVLGLDMRFRGPAQRRARRSPSVRHLESATRGHRRPARRLLRQLLALPELAASAATRTSRRTCRWTAGAPRCARATSRRPRERRRPGRSAATFTVFRQRDDEAESPLARRHAAGPTTPTCRRSSALHQANARALRRPHGQLVHPRHRQPVLRRHQHRAAASPTTWPATTASRTGSWSGGRPERAVLPLGAGRRVPAPGRRRRSSSTTGRPRRGSSDPACRRRRSPRCG